jgi:hypothetical protein
MKTPSNCTNVNYNKYKPSRHGHDSAKFTTQPSSSARPAHGHTPRGLLFKRLTPFFQCFYSPNRSPHLISLQISLRCKMPAAGNRISYL